MIPLLSLLFLMPTSPADADSVIHLDCESARSGRGAPRSRVAFTRTADGKCDVDVQTQGKSSGISQSKGETFRGLPVAEFEFTALDDGRKLLESVRCATGKPSQYGEAREFTATGGHDPEEPEGDDEYVLGETRSTPEPSRRSEWEDIPIHREELKLGSAIDYRCKVSVSGS
jgi:hypothetical protein